MTITSTGSGSSIIRDLGGSISDFLSNKVTGLALDVDGSTPGPIYKDSIYVTLYYPNGAGSITAAIS